MTEGESDEVREGSESGLSGVTSEVRLGRLK